MTHVYDFSDADLSQNQYNWENTTDTKKLCYCKDDCTMCLICECPESFYHAMHYSAKRGLAIACRLSICL